MNPQAMNKNTGDGELTFEQQQEVDRLSLQANTPSSNQNKHRYNLYAYIEQIAAQEANKAQQQLLQELKKYAAQEANKPQQQLLKGLLEQMPNTALSKSVVFPLKFTSHKEHLAYDRGAHFGRLLYAQEVKSVIQNKLEGLS